MFSNVLGSTLTQVLRSIALVLLPTSFITLLAWASAGSATGNTGDPLRAALWIWLGAHHVPFSLNLPPQGIEGFLSYLPLGALVVPVLAVRIGVARVIDRLEPDARQLNFIRILFAIFYASIGTLFAYFSATKTVQPQWYLAPIFILLIALASAASVGRQFVFGQAIAYGIRILALLLGISSIAFGVLLFINFSKVENLTLILEPGIIGGFLLLLLNIVYIPNAVVATLGYFSGAGFAVGTGSILSPLSLDLNSIPAFPLLAAVPSLTSEFALLGALIVILAGALLAGWSSAMGTRTLIQSLFASVFLVALTGYAGSGALITDAMSAIGVSPWKFTLAVGGELVAGAILARLFLRVIRR